LRAPDRFGPGCLGGARLMHQAAKRAGAACIGSRSLQVRLTCLCVAFVKPASLMSQRRCRAAGCLGDRTASPGECMSPAAAHHQSDAPVHTSLADAAAATTGLVVHPPHLVALDQDHQRRALDALLELLTAALGRIDGAQPSSPNPTDGQPGWPDSLGDWKGVR